MNRLQRIIAVATLLGVATFLHFFFCDWVIRPSTSPPVFGSDGRAIVTFSPTSGIRGRSNSAPLDAVAGVAAPLLMTGGALFIIAGRRGSDR